jgi:hypothetical protein
MWGQTTIDRYQKNSPGTSAIVKRMESLFITRPVAKGLLPKTTTDMPEFIPMSKARVLALTQLFIVGLGGPALCLLIKIEHKNIQPEMLAKLAEFLAAHVLWLFAVPILYAAIGSGLQGRVSDKVIQWTGVVICGLLVAVLGPLIILYLL